MSKKKNANTKNQVEKILEEIRYISGKWEDWLFYESGGNYIVEQNRTGIRISIPRHVNYQKFDQAMRKIFGREEQRRKANADE